LRALKRAILEEHYKRRAEEGIGIGSGDRTNGTRNPVAITKGDPVGDWVI
jgi:hypothetical protein